ncbi:MAG: amidohydrolase family protein [Phycisphaerae bacterium]|nr:amidohydrolase family protein [Gemmatimonadaceae bacterium]
MRKAAIAALSGAFLFSTHLFAQQPPAGGPPAGGRGGGRGSAIPPGEQCPAGTTEIRPNMCLGPQIPVPSILDYRPRSTLVAPTHMVRTAKFPVIDFHGHPPGLGFTAGVDTIGFKMDSLNVRMMIAADNMSGERLKVALAAVRNSPKMKDRVRILTGINFQNVGPGWAEKAIAQLEADVKEGAVGVGEIGKQNGLSVKKADGTRLKIDDPELDPVWAACARLNLPVFIHTGDPPEFLAPLYYNNERWLEMALFPESRYPSDPLPTWETLATERNNMFKRNSKTTFITAHMGWHANDLGKLGKMLDEMPNLYTEVGAVLYDIGRQPRAAHDFFVKYQNRILFGKDSFQPEEYPYYWRVFETRDDYFDYYRGYHAFWKLYGVDLPDVVLKKVYYQNALRITPRLPQTGWPK